VIVPSRDTRPERAVRRLLHLMGYRFRLHRDDLPGCPDIVFPARRKAIFVHGCFWHGHGCRPAHRRPKKRAAYWEAKIAATRRRDAAQVAALDAAGWETLTVWECEIERPRALLIRLRGFLGAVSYSGPRRRRR